MGQEALIWNQVTPRDDAQVDNDIDGLNASDDSKTSESPVPPPSESEDHFNVPINDATGNETRRARDAEFQGLDINRVPDRVIGTVGVFLDCKSILNLACTSRTFVRLMQASEAIDLRYPGRIWYDKMMHQLHRWLTADSCPDAEKMILAEGHERALRKLRVRTAVHDTQKLSKEDTERANDDNWVTTLYAEISSWKTVYATYPRIRLDGMYISNCCYNTRIRKTGNINCKNDEERRTFNDVSLTHVKLYRLIQFLPSSSTVLVFNATTDKSRAIEYLRRVARAELLGKQPPIPEDFGVESGQGVLRGSWQWVDVRNRILAVLAHYSPAHTGDSNLTQYRLRLCRMEGRCYNTMIFEHMALLDGTILETKEEHTRPYAFVSDARLAHML